MDDIQTAWVAGLIEGEGCIAEYVYTRRGDKQYKKTLLQVEMTDQDTLNKLLKLTNKGSVIYKKARSERQKETWVWTVSRRTDVEDICRSILPHMSVRRTEKIISMFPNMAI